MSCPEQVSRPLSVALEELRYALAAATLLAMNNEREARRLIRAAARATLQATRD